MKKILFLWMFVILLLPSVIAMDWDNVRDYNPKTDTVTITNALGFGEDLAEITLIDNSYYCLENCEANILLDLKVDYESAFKELDFYTIKNDKLKKTNIKNFKVSKRIGQTETLKTRVSTSCDRAIGLDSDECRETTDQYVEIEYHYEEVNLKENLVSGRYYIKIEGTKDKNEDIEWIATFLGEEIKEWAVWESNLNNRLLAYWTLNGTMNDSRGVHNGSAFNTRLPTPAGYGSCKLDNCYLFNGSSALLTDEEIMGIELNKTVVFGDSFSVMVWENATNSTLFNYYQPILTSPNQYGWEFLIYAGTGISPEEKGDLHLLYGKDGHRPGESVEDIDTNTNVADGNFHQIILTRDASDPVSLTNGNITEIWVDGNKVLSTSINWTFNNYTGHNFTLGRRNIVGTFFFNGTIDDVGMWNRTLSDIEISNLWNGGDGIEYLNLTDPVPTQTNPILNTTLRTNLTIENLTCWNQSTDGAGYDVKNIYSWYKDNYTIEQLNLPFEGNGGGESTATNDFSSNNNSMEVTGALWNTTRGYDGFGAYKFNGTTDWVDTINTTIFDNVENFTISAWFNSSEDDYQYIINKILVVGIRVVDDDTLQIVMYNETAQRAVSFDPTGGSILNDWHHVAMRYDSANANLTGWFDGEKKADISAQGGLKTINSEVRVGARGNGDSPFNGTIDDVRVYYDALSEEQIKFLWGNKTHFLSSNETTSDEVYICNVVPINENGEGERLNSTGLLILENKIPVINNVTIHPNQTNIYYGEIVNCSTDIDVDNSISSLYFSWYEQNNLTTHLIDGTQLYLPFESESNATYTKDYSNYDYNGTIKGPSYLSTGGYDGFGAYNFTGSLTNYIDAGNSTRYNSTEGTISVWVYPITSSQGFLWGARVATGDHIQSIYQIASNKTGYTILADGSTYNLVTSVMEQGQWHHVVTTWGSSGMQIYLNGVLNDSNGYTGSWDGGSNLRIGNTERYPTNGFNGTLDEFQIYDRQLSNTEILAIYNTGLIHQKIDNVLDGTHFAAYNLTPSYQNIGGNYTCGIIINDQINPIQYANSTEFYINSSIYDYSLYPGIEVNATNDINGSFQYEGDGTTDVIFNWFKNGALWLSKTFVGIISGQWVSYLLDEGNFTTGDNITLQVSTEYESSNISVFIHLPTNLSSMTWITTEGFQNSTLNRELEINYLNVTFEGVNGLNLTVNITYPNSTNKVTDGVMNNISFYNYRYETNFDLDQSGEWNISITAQYGDDTRRLNNSIYVRDAIETLTNIFNSTVGEGSVQGFSSNITYIDQGVASISSELIYNITSYITTRSDEDSGYYYSKGGINSQTGITADHFRWNFSITMDNGNLYYNLSEWYTVFPVLPININNCTAANATWAIAYNFTLNKEMNDTSGFINQKISSTLKIFPLGSTNYVNATFVENDSELIICVEQAPYNNYTFEVDGHIEYSADNHDKRNYFLVNNLMNNKTQNISLYLLEIPFGTETRVYVQDQNTQPLEGYYTKIQRYYVDENAYKVVAMLRSDEDGRDITYLREDDAWYRFVVENNGEVVYTDPDARKISRDEGYSYATVILTVSTVTTLDETLAKFENIQHNLTFNNITNNFIFFYSDPTGGASEYCLYVYKSLPQNDTFICDTCSTSTSATILCNVGTASNGTYIAYSYAKGSKLLLSELAFRFDRSLRNLFGIEGFFPAIFLIGTAAFIGAIVGGNVGVVLLVLMALLVIGITGLVEISIFALMGLLALGVAIIVGLRQRGG